MKFAIMKIYNPLAGQFGRQLIADPNDLGVFFYPDKMKTEPPWWRPRFHWSFLTVGGGPATAKNR